MKENYASSLQLKTIYNLRNHKSTNQEQRKLCGRILIQYLIKLIGNHNICVNTFQLNWILNVLMLITI
ncbi:unnamed protein product [Paramecium sonneborni]|uniref:Uncharacterized protein n=1 Tax=Paramecium sonneborni TaxID=65129 RepID=A0A8S1PMG5_9CILI|nr:unnamed protein product [Paramecium sonneborni]